ncbi:hypothetical protein [Demequina lutea]|uniref:Uncharacterized protein n=1 Tax=Demequina lutea TaxID=431489 RepID=A0A7Y9Z852_9MICO|nr:hypothetical protein [Demequina lutea]NYI40587.1 hypothetical protein [Demequina lutea]
MPPAGLLAIIAVGLALAYVLPQRIRERSDYALVRTEDRYSADMRVVRASAARVAPRDASSASTEIPLLVTGAARAKVSALGDQHMSRPQGPLDKAATHAQRESLHLRQDRLGSMAQRAIQARRRAAVSGIAAATTLIAWILVAATGFPAIIAALFTAALATAVASSAKAGAAERQALAQVRGVTREVEAAATATRALRAVAAARAGGVHAEPSAVATQAIAIVTSADLAPLAAPALTRRAAAERAAHAVAVEAAIQAAAAEESQVLADEAAGWRPRTMPVPAYALKPAVRQQVARPMSEDDYAASTHAYDRSARAEASVERSAQQSPTTGALDAILARRKQASA